MFNKRAQKAYEARLKKKKKPPPPTEKDSIFTFSNVLSVISLTIAVLGTLGTIYYNFFWHPEQLQVSYRITHKTMDTSLVSFIFINNGRQAVAIDTITLLKAISNDAPLDACETTNTRVQEQFKERDNWEILETQSTGSWVTTGYEDSTGLAVQYIDREYEIKRARKLLLDNKDSPSSSFLVDPQSAKVLNIEYDAESDGVRNDIYCLQINFFDRLGAAHSQVLPAWSVTRRDGDLGPVFGYGKEVRQYTLLPAR
jgi:hypothetical protein